MGDSRDGSSKTGLPADINFLKWAMIDHAVLEQAARVAVAKDMSASEVLIARNEISRCEYLRLLAANIGASMLKGEIDPRSLILPESIRGDSAAMLTLAPTAFVMEDGRRKIVLSPRGSEPMRLATHSQHDRRTGQSKVIAEYRHLKRAIFERFEEQIALQAIGFLRKRYAHFSASVRVSAGQALVMSGLLAIVATLAWHWPGKTLFSAAAVLSLIYLAMALFRASLIVRVDKLPTEPVTISRITDACSEDYPVYSVLVPMYLEANQVEPLVDSLNRLNWPRHRLEVLLICESRDSETVRTVQSTALPEAFQLIICPDNEPRTKPKALNFALPLCSGEFVVIYDAEDRPHPEQLMEAWSHFRQADRSVACLQAPLAVNNRDQNWLTGMFGLEYDTLFRGILPASAGITRLLPLGGTSNNFRIDALKSVAAWDPYNVTEDADLGIRLARLGFRSEVITLAIQGEAPSIFRIWLGQRTRWLKGWIQTMLVHTRNPVRIIGELGWSDTIHLHLFMTAQVLSVMFHPLMVIFAIFQLACLAGGHRLDHIELAFLGFTIFNLVAGYTTYGYLAIAVQRRLGANRTKQILAFPIYWVLISIAGWNAIRELIMNPFHWEKTEHGLANIASCGNIRRQ